MGSISFTLSQRCVNITKAISYGNCIRTRSSGDRAPPSGGGSGGSNPPGCVLFLLFSGIVLWREVLWKQMVMRSRQDRTGIKDGAYSDPISACSDCRSSQFDLRRERKKVQKTGISSVLKKWCCKRRLREYANESTKRRDE